MSVRPVAMLSVHTSPLAQPGAGDGGGMNVYVRSLASNLARAGVACDVLTRADHAEQPPVAEVEPGFRVVHLAAGPIAPVPKAALPELVDPFVDAALDFFAAEEEPPDVLHANYWISGAVAHRLKHELDLPLVATFHTLDRVKAEAGVGDDPETRARVEGEIVRCADLMIAATDDERRQLVTLYDAQEDRIEVVPPGVDHRVFVPGDRAAARRRRRGPGIRRRRRPHGLPRRGPRRRRLRGAGRRASLASRARNGDGRERARAFEPVHVEHRGGTVAALVRRPRDPSAGGVLVGVCGDRRGP